MRGGQEELIKKTLSQAILVLGAPVVAAGVGGYRRAYDAVLDLHLTHELQMIYRTTGPLPSTHETTPRRSMTELSKNLANRLDLTLPTFRSREQVLSMRRTAFSLG